MKYLSNFIFVLVFYCVILLRHLEGFIPLKMKYRDFRVMMFHWIYTIPYCRQLT